MFGVSNWVKFITVKLWQKGRGTWQTGKRELQDLKSFEISGIYTLTVVGVFKVWLTSTECNNSQLVNWSNWWLAGWYLHSEICCEILDFRLPIFFCLKLSRMNQLTKLTLHFPFLPPKKRLLQFLEVAETEPNLALVLLPLSLRRLPSRLVPFKKRDAISSWYYWQIPWK